MAVQLPELARKLLDGRTFAVLSTVSPDGSPQSSVVWVKRDGDEAVFSTITSRRKARNMARDGRVSLCAYDPDAPYHYVEIRGSVSMSEQGGRELIDELSVKYTGNAYPAEPESNVRVVCRIAADKVVSH